MPRIAYVCSDPGVPVHGPSGSSVHVRSLVAALAAEGAEVRVVAARRGAGDGALPAVEETRGGPASALLAKERGAARETGRILAALEAERRLRQLHRETPFDLVYERYSLWGTGGLDFARRHQIPFFLEVNAPLVDEASRHRGLVLIEAARALETLLLGHADRVFVVSSALAAHAVARGAEESRVVLTPNGVDHELFATVQPAARADRRFRVGFVGSLKPWHGIPVLLEAFHELRRLAPAELVVIGEGPLAEEIRQAGEEAGDDSIRMLGAVAHEAIPALLADLDVTVAPYPERDLYFSPLKVVESMAAGVCVVASRSGDLATIVRDGETGLLVEPGDPQALAAALYRLAEDRPLTRRLGEAARAEVLVGRTWRAIARRVLDQHVGLGKERDADRVDA